MSSGRGQHGSATPGEYERIRPMIADVFGMARSKYIPAERFLGGTPNRKTGSTNHCITLFGQQYDKSLVPGAPGSQFFEGMPDVSSRFELADVRPGWDEGVGVVVGDMYFRDELYSFAPRTVLRNAIAKWKAVGLAPMIGIELEAYVFEKNAGGEWVPASHDGGITYGVGALVDRHGLLDEIMRCAKTSGLRLETVNSEYDSPQFEFTLEYADALSAVDDVLLFRQMSMEVAAKRGLRITFMGKPIANLAGSGLHVNLSAQNKKGLNAFVGGRKDAHQLSDVARWSIGGLLDHHEALTAICAPTVNSYKRLRPGQLAGVWANWGIDHRSVTIRVPAERDEATRVEHRAPCGSANPYLAVAAILSAAMLGIEGKIEPPAIETGDALETANTDRKTPETLAAALDALEADPAFVEALGVDVVANFLVMKRDEWDKFMAAVTDWELRYYGPFI